MAKRGAPTPPIPQAHRQRGDGAECLRKVKTKTTATDIGVKISEIDRIGNDLTDAIAKEALSRFPDDPIAQELFEKNERAVTAWAKWIGILGTLDIEDDCRRPPQKRPASRRLGIRLGHARLNRPHILVWDNDSDLCRCQVCGNTGVTRNKPTGGKPSCRGKRWKVMVHTEGEFAVDGHRLWILGDWA